MTKRPSRRILGDRAIEGFESRNLLSTMVEVAASTSFPPTLGHAPETSFPPTIGHSVAQIMGGPGPKPAP